MDKRRVLWGTIRAMLLALVLGFLFILFRSLSGPSITSSSAQSAFDNVVVGQTALRRSGRQRFWVTRISDSQRTQAKALSDWLVDANAGCAVEQVLCVVHAESLRSGIDLVYSVKAPIQLPKEALWFGGFVDPSTGGVFDFMGRAYKDIRSDDQRSQLELYRVN